MRRWAADVTYSRNRCRYSIIALSTKPLSEQRASQDRSVYQTPASRKTAHSMKVPIDQHAMIDLTAPVLPAYETLVDGSTRWVVWCEHCDMWHYHGPAEGHREAHCNDPANWKPSRNSRVKTYCNLARPGECS